MSWPAHVRQKILRCRSSPSGLQLRKSALPIFPTGGIAATAPVCVQPASIFRQAYDYDSSRLIVLASPCSSKNSALPIFPVGPPAAQICAADFSRWWHRCHCPSARPARQYFSSSLRLRLVQTHRQLRLPILPTLPIPALPAVSKQALSRQPTPLTNFPAWPGQPMFVKKSALPIFPDDQQSFSSSLGLSSPEIPGMLPDRIPASATPFP